MRIIAGAKRGMKLFSPKGFESRPIPDRVKESLFSVLYSSCVLGDASCEKEKTQYAIRDTRYEMVADLFCGVGSLGLEALSRGAKFVTFVEKDPKVISTLKKNIEKAGFLKESKVVRADAFKAGAVGNEQKCDLIFIDPPYSATRETKEGSPLSKLLALLSEQSSLDGIVVVRTERRTELLEQYGRFEVIERRQWGTMAVTIYRKVSLMGLQRSSK